MTSSETTGREPPFASPTIPGSARTFVDRDRELGELTEAVDEALAGRGRLFLVSGEAGIGKTALALELADRAARLGARVVWGRCREGGGAPAYWPWIQVIRALVRARGAADLGLDPGAQYLRQLVPDLLGKLPVVAPASPPDLLESDHDRFYLFDAVSGLLRAVAPPGAIVLLLDDLHWADSSSLLLLRFLAGEVQESNILIVATYRETEARRFEQTADMLRELGRLGSRMVLTGFEPPQIASLIAQTAGVDAPVRLVSEIHRLTRGNPFFIDELVRLLAAEGRLGQPRALATAELKIPEGVRQLIRRRLAPISSPCRELLSAAAIIGREFPLALLAPVTTFSRDALPEALADAVTAEIVEESPESIGVYRFTHTLIRETLYSEVPHSRRLQLHAQVGGVLEQLHAADLEPYVTDLAFHYMRATPVGSVSKALAYAIRAGRKAAERLAYDEAAAYFAQALDGFDVQGDGDLALRCEVLLDLGEAQRKSGSGSAAATTFERAADLALKIESPEQFARAALRWGGAAGPLGETSEIAGKLNRGQIAALEQALARLAPDDTPLRARLLGRLASALYWDPGSEARRAELCDEAVAMARRLNDPVEISAALTCKRSATWGVDDLEQRLVEMNEAVRLAEQFGDRERGLLCRVWRIGDLLELGNAYGAEIEIDVYSRLAGALRQPLFSSYAAMLRGVRALLRGRFAEAEALGGEALRLGLAAQNPLAPVYAGAQMYRCAFERGDMAVLEAALAGIRAQADVAVLRCGLALVLAEVGKLDAARAEFDELASEDFVDLRKDMTWLPAMIVLARVCKKLDDRERAALLYDRLAPYAGRIVLVGPPVADCLGPVDQFLGELAAILGRADAASQHLEAALRQSLAMGAVPFAAEIWLAQAELLVRGGKQDAAVELVRQSLEVAESLGMKRLADRARALRAGSLERPPQSVAASERAVLQKRGDYWTVSYGGVSGDLKDALGLHYLAHLLRHPRQEFHVMDLAALSSRELALDERESRGERELADRSSPDLGHAGEVLDSRARSEYLARIESLKGELEEATGGGDVDRADGLRAEIKFLERELSSAYGLGGRARRGADVSERVRKAVTNRIRDALAKVQAQNPALGGHLAKSVKMGTFCSYAPENALLWTL